MGLPGGAAEDVPVCLDLRTASATAIETKKKKRSTIPTLSQLYVRLCTRAMSKRLFLGIEVCVCCCCFCVLSRLILLWLV